jgi:formyl-CoA transferase
MALFQRGATGEGQYIDLSIMESSLENIEIILATSLLSGGSAKRGPHVGVPWDMYQCADGYAAVISMPARHWHKGSEILNDPELFQEQYRHILGRVSDRAVYEERISACVREKSKKNLFHEGQARNLAFGYLAGLDEVVESPQHRRRGFFVKMDHPVAGEHLCCDAPFKMFETPWTSERAPLLGEHNQEIYETRIGFGMDEIKDLYQEGVI